MGIIYSLSGAVCFSPLLQIDQLFLTNSWNKLQKVNTHLENAEHLKSTSMFSPPSFQICVFVVNQKGSEMTGVEKVNKLKKVI